LSYFAAAVTRNAKVWTAAELDLSGAADLDDVTERLRDLAPDAEVAVLFVESDDAYLVVLRLDEGEDLRVFGSDSMFAEESRLGAMLLGDLEEPALEIDDVDDDVDDADDEEEEDEDDEEPPAAAGDLEPVGDSELLSDLGMPAHRLLELCAQEGMLPADITAEVCQALGCGDEVEELREA
jgi:putative tRNA adenosine deaminase-associated protein